MLLTIQMKANILMSLCVYQGAQCLHESKIFPFRVDQFSEGDENNMHEVASLESVSSPSNCFFELVLNIARIKFYTHLMFKSALWKHAFSNILKISPQKTENILLKT